MMTSFTAIFRSRPAGWPLLSQWRKLRGADAAERPVEFPSGVRTALTITAFLIVFLLFVFSPPAKNKLQKPRKRLLITCFVVLPPTAYRAWVICPRLAGAHGVHELGENVAAVEGACCRRSRAAGLPFSCRFLKSARRFSWDCFFLSVGPGEFQRFAHLVLGGVGVAEGVHADDRQLAAVLQGLVVERLLLDLALW